MVVIGVLASLVFLRLLSVRRLAQEANVHATLRELRHAVKLFESDVGAYPPNLKAVTATAPPSTGLHLAGGSVQVVTLSEEQKKRWAGPYLETHNGNLPVNLLSGGNQEGTDWIYESSDPAEIGNVRLDIPGTDSTGVPYNSW